MTTKLTNKLTKKLTKKALGVFYSRNRKIALGCWKLIFIYPLTSLILKFLNSIVTIKYQILLNYNLKGVNTVDLVKLLQRKHPDKTFDFKRLKTIYIIGKTKHGIGSIGLNNEEGFFQISKRVKGCPEKFESDSMRTFYKIRFNITNQLKLGNLKFEGNHKVKSIKLFFLRDKESNLQNLFLEAIQKLISLKDKINFSQKTSIYDNKFLKKDNLKICLIQCPAWGRTNPPLGLALIASVLKQNRYIVNVYDFNNIFYHKTEQKDLFELINEKFWVNTENVKELFFKNIGIVNTFVSLIIKESPDIVGFSVQVSSFMFSLHLAHAIKKRKPNILIVFGGSQCARHFTASDFILKDYIDAVFMGEAEKSFLIFLENYKNGEIAKTPGALIKKEDSIIDGGYCPSVTNLDNIPLPDFSFFDLNLYDSPNILPIMSSRGCVNRCSFCTERLMKQKFQFRSGISLFNEIIYQKKSNPHVDCFFFHDSLINGNVNELKRFSSLLIKNDINIKWHGQAIIRKEMTYEYLKLLQEAGCTNLSYGIESGSNAILKLMNKPFNIELAEKVVRNSANAGLFVVVNFMFGFPGETDEDFNKTLFFLDKNAAYITCVNPSLGLCVIGAGTYLYNHLENFNVDLQKGSVYWESKDGMNTYLIRLQRHKEFVQLAKKRGIKLNINYNDEYYENMKNKYIKAFGIC